MIQRKIGTILVVLLGTLGAAVPAEAQSLAQTFFVPVPEVQVRTWADSMTVLAENDEIHSVISITATAPDTVLYYDHWEDGFESDITLPLQSTTEVWGDQDCSNGFTPTLVACVVGVDDANDVIAADDVLILESDVPVPGGVRDLNQIFFDGGDRMAVTEFVAVTRAAWPSTGVEAQLGGAVEVFDTQRWGTTFEAPVGENTGGPAAFEFVSLSIMAEEDGTVVDVDINADGVDDQTFVLNQGQSVLVGQVGVQDVLAGATVSASSDVQVDLLTSNENTTYEGRWYSQVPTADWDTRYFSPVGSTVAGDQVHVFVYNPGTSPISVAASQQSGCSNVAIPAGGFVEIAIGVTTPISAAEFSTELTCGGVAGSDSPFFAIATIDRNETIHDWGFTLIPTSSLTPTAVVGWAPGSTNLTENASPVWMTAVDPPGGTTTIFVDFDGDPTTGPLTDTFGNNYDLSCTVSALESVRIFDGGGTGACTVSPGDFDHTGMRIYTLDGTRITAAWGQDPEFSASGQPQQLDMGTTVLPFSSLTAFKQGALLGDTNGNGGLDPGETILYTIRVKNTGIIPITDIDLLDTLDSNTAYVAETTEVDGVPVADNASGTPFPLDGDPVATGYPLVVSPDELAPGEEVIVTFVAIVNDPLPPSVSEIVNQVIVSSDTETFVDADTTPLQRADLDIVKTSSGAGSEVGPGQTITYTVTVTNSSPAPVTGVRISDSVPSGTSYVAGSTEAIGPQQIYVADRFETQAYNNNDGPANWSGDWVETDASGGGPGGGDVQIVSSGTSGELRIEDDTSAIARGADLSALSGGFSMLSFDFRTSAGVDSGDFVLVQGSTGGTGGPFSTVPGGTFEGIDGDQNPMPSGRLAFDLSGFIASGSAFRFDIPTNDFNGTDEFFFADNLELRTVGAGDFASDDFVSGTYAGGSDSGPAGTRWTGPWSEIDSAGGGAGGGEVLITGGEARLGTAGNSLSRTVDLSGAVLAMLRFDWDTSADLENDDELEVQVATNGVDFTTLGAFINDPDGTRSYDLTPYISATTTIRFSVEQNTTGSEFFSIDNVDVLAGRHTNITKDNSGGGNPQLVDGATPNLVIPADNFALAPGESMTVTFDVTVDDPINLPRIVNTATVTAFEKPDPASSTVVDPVIVGGAIGDLVWLDTDGDGVYDIGEPGISDVRVWLDVDGDGIFTPGVDREQMTDANGNYLFGNTAPGTYDVYVDETTLPGPLATAPGTTNPYTSVTITLADELVLDADFGYVPMPGTAVVGDYVWSDADGDGIQDAGEIGLGGVTVTLVNAGPDGIFGTGDDTTATTTTDADGSYLFTGVSPGEYRVETSGIPAGYTVTVGPQSEGSDISSPFTVAGGDALTDVDFGYQNATLYSIIDTVWFDTDTNGLLDGAEEGIAGVTVNLLNSAGDLVGTTVSGPDGTFTFDGIDDGDYTIQIGDTAGALEGLFGTTVPGQDRQLAVTVSGSDITGENFGYSTAGWIGDRVWSDADGDGVQDPGEAGLGGVVVDLVDVSTGMVVASTTTAADGSYLFQNLLPGAYVVQVSGGLPAGATQTGDPTQPGVPCTVCDNQSSAVIITFTSNLQQDFGYQTPALSDISGTVFTDPDRDGVLDPGEPGIGVVTLDLVDAGPDGIFGTNDDLVVATTTTAPDGTYQFTDVPDGDYQVRVTDDGGVLEGFDLTSGLDAIDVTAVAGSDVTGIDFGYIRDEATGSIGDFVWIDADRDGVVDTGEAGVPGVTLDLIDVGPDGLLGTADDVGVVASTITGATGRYVFSGLEAGNYVVDITDTSGVLAGLAPTVGTTDPSAVVALSEGEFFEEADFGYASAVGSALGDRVWYDADGDGFQDPGEVGIGGVTVNLYDPGPDGLFGTPDDVFLGSRVTAADGSYLFTGIAPGTVYVEIDTTTLPAGYNTIPTNGPSTRPFDVPAGQDVLTADFGFDGGAPGSLFGTVYFDGDGSSSQDPGEVGLEFVTVDLVDATTGTIIATTTTDANGDYSFLGVPPGDYNVIVTDLDGIASELNATETPGLPVTVVSVPPGSPVTDVDFGYAPTTAGAGTIGDLVFHDVDGNGTFDPLGADGIPGTADDESGFESVTVELWVDVDNDGIITPGIDNLVRSTITDTNGNYEFLGLPFDSYLVTVTDENGVLDINGNGIVHGDEWTQTAGVDPTPVTLDAANPSNLDADFGYQAVAPELVSGTVFFDFLGNGVLDPGDTGVANAVLGLYRDLDGDGVLDPEDPLIGMTVSSDGTIDVDGDGIIDPAGFYAFGDLVEGDYLVTVDTTATFVDGLEQTTQLPSNPNEPAVVIAGACTDCAGNDFGFTVATTRVLISSFSAVFDGGGISIEFETAAQDGTVGFYLYRWDDELEDYVQVNEQLLPAAIGSPQGATYRLSDPGARSEGLTYALVEVESGGAERTYGPFTAKVRNNSRSRSFSGQDVRDVTPRVMPEQAAHRLERAALGRRGGAERDELVSERGVRGSRRRTRAKITTRGEGLHFVSSEEISDALGLPLTRIARLIELEHLRLSNLGEEVAWLAGDLGSGIFFFASEVDSPYTADNVYWLELGAGSTMETGFGGNPVAGAVTTFESSVHFEQDLFPVTVLGQSSEQDFYYWSYVSAGHPTYGSAVLPIDVSDPALGASGATLTVGLQGSSSTPASTDHQVVVSLNGLELGTGSWDGSVPHQVELDVPAGYLLAGENTVEITGILGQGIPYSVFLVDSLDLTYERQHIAVADRLGFGADGNAVVTVGGFSSSDVILLQVDDVRRPQLVSGASTSGIGPFSVSLVPSDSQARFVAATATTVMSPVSVEGRRQSDLERISGAEYVVIAPGALRESADALANYRLGYGLSSRVVELEEIFDQFSFGLSSPEAIRDFLQLAYENWSVQVRFAALVGAASFDYKDVQGVGDNLLPTLMTQTPYGLFASDGSLADFVGGDGIPDIAIGRIPVLTNAELLQYVDKLAAAESLGIGVGPSRVAMLADNDDAAGAFSVDSDELLPLIPAGTDSDRIYLSEQTTGDARAQLFSAVGDGVGLVNYLGHGGLDRFAEEGLVTVQDASALVGGRLPVVTSLTCSAGRHEVPGWTSLGEALVLEPGAGAAAVFAPSGQSVHVEAIVLNEALFKAVFETRTQTIGEAVQLALQDYGAEANLDFMLRIYNLLGDPAYRIW